MIRQATAFDIEAMVAIGARFFAASNYSRVAEFSPRVFADALERMIGSDDAAVFVNDSDGIQGMAAVIVYPFYMAEGMTGQELFWWDESGNGQSMRLAMEEWSRAKGAAVSQMSSLAGLRDDAMERMYRVNGYVPAEHVFVKEL